MGNIVLNVALGRLAYYCSLPAASDGLVAVPIETTGIVADSVMRDYDDLAALLAGASNEQATMGRQALTGVTATVDDTNDRVNIDSADIVWPAATGNPVAALVICYDPDTTAGADTDLIPLIKLDCALTPDGTDFTAVVSDLARITSAA